MAPPNIIKTIDKKINGKLAKAFYLLTTVQRQVIVFIKSSEWIDAMLKMDVVTEFSDKLSDLLMLFNVEILEVIESTPSDNRTVDEMLDEALHHLQDCKSYLSQSKSYEYMFKFRDLELRIKDLIFIYGNAKLSGPSHPKKSSNFEDVASDYSYALDILDKYDHQQLEITDTTLLNIFSIHYRFAREAITELKGKFGGGVLFGNEKDDSFKGSIASIYQTFEGMELYPSVEEKAANLLYFIVKNHSFSDGNKRIAAFIFVWFLAENNLLYKTNGTKRIADNALVAIVLLIAESRAEEKTMLIKIVVNLINLKN